jgi:EAL domain-containing protein (putative c-di-GMP-specific phosphodiesterase class I)
MNAGDRLRSALDNDEFCLYCQTIRPLDAGSATHEAPFYEILIRLREEEEGLMPPGAFLPLAEEYGLLPDLDRWVVRHVIEWSRAKPERQAITFAINISAATISNPDFADYVAGELQRQGASGSLLCFEIADADAYSRRKDIARLISTLGPTGCRTTLSGFGQSAESFSLLKHIAVDFLKIDGDIILDLHRNPVALTKLKAIMRVAQATNRRTIAEFVESEETLATLREFGVDYAQGFGIGLPRPLSDLG